MSTTTEVKGLADLQRALDQLPAKIEQNIMRGALRAGAKVILEDAKRRVPVATPNAENQRLYGGREGLLRDSIRLTTRSRRGQLTVNITAGGDKVKGGGDAYYAHFVEFGTKPHTITAGPGKFLPLGNGFLKSVMHPGSRPNPFMRNALDQNVTQSVEAVREYVRQRLAVKHGIDVPGPDSSDPAP
jgi:HK97 gp10 family phage protein